VRVAVYLPLIVPALAALAARPLADRLPLADPLPPRGCSRPRGAPGSPAITGVTASANTVGVRIAHSSDICQCNEQFSFLPIKMSNQGLLTTVADASRKNCCAALPFPHGSQQRLP
jgi:hypothetical protein